MSTRPLSVIPVMKCNPAMKDGLHQELQKIIPLRIEYHKGEGLSGVLESEVRGLRMMGIHFFGNREEGQAIKAKMPEAFCLKCHSEGEVVSSHVPFQTGGQTCADCHKHRVGWKFKGQEQE